MIVIPVPTDCILSRKESLFLKVKNIKNILEVNQLR